MSTDRYSFANACWSATPVALFVASLGFDLVELWLPEWAWASRVAFYAMAAGFVAALAVLVPRIVDWTTEPHPRLRRLARTHAWVTGGAITAYGLSLWLRQHGLPGTGTPLWLSIGGVMLLALSTTIDSELAVASDGAETRR